MKTKTILIISIFFITGWCKIFPQEQNFILENETLNPASFIQFPLTDHQGNLVTSFQSFLPDGQPGRIEFTLGNERIVLNNALNNVCYNPLVKRIYMYGDDIQAHKQFYFSLRIFDEKGNLTGSVENAGHAPFVTAIAPNGDVYVSLYTESQGKSAPVLRKYDKQGNLLWTRDLEGSVPSLLEVTPDGNYAIAVQADQVNTTSVISVYTAEGVLLRNTRNTGFISDIVHSVSGRMLVIAQGKWYLYNRTGDENPVKEGILTGDPVQKYPAVFSPDERYFVLLTAFGDQYILQAVKTSDGSIMNESRFAGSPVWVFYRIIRFVDQLRLELFTDRKTFKLKINEQ